MLDELLPRLRTPFARFDGLTVDEDHPVRRAPDGSIESATLVGPDGSDPSLVRGGIWEALGDGTAPKTLAQLTNVFPPVTRLYESAWRVRSLSLLSRRPFPIREELAELDVALGEVEGAVALDVGCSEGLYARHLGHRGASVLAVDHSLRFLRRTRARAQRARSKVAPVQAVAQRLPIGDAQIDVVTIGGTLNEIGDVDAALAEITRVTKPGGRVFVMSLAKAPTSAGRVLQTLAKPGGIEFPTVAQTTAAFARAGLRLEDQRIDGVVIRSTLTRS